MFSNFNFPWGNQEKVGITEKTGLYISFIPRSINHMLPEMSASQYEKYGKLIFFAIKSNTIQYSIHSISSALPSAILPVNIISMSKYLVFAIYAPLCHFSKSSCLSTIQNLKHNDYSMTIFIKIINKNWFSNSPSAMTASPYNNPSLITEVLGAAPLGDPTYHKVQTFCNNQ